MAGNKLEVTGARYVLEILLLIAYSLAFLLISLIWILDTVRGGHALDRMDTDNTLPSVAKKRAVPYLLPLSMGMSSDQYVLCIKAAIQGMKSKRVPIRN